MIIRMGGGWGCRGALSVIRNNCGYVYGNDEKVRDLIEHHDQEERKYIHGMVQTKAVKFRRTLARKLKDYHLVFETALMNTRSLLTYNSGKISPPLTTTLTQLYTACD